ncbi:MAG: hypothetical protein JWM25_1547 [Thermoleophilia bacterium]|nr:hypothetical protein [Thermoleophilia bacterium]MCZ4496962.1 hypothetical protein [Thermoleophilia bacterium]
MRTRNFIGLIMLVLALMVASTPELLTPAAKGAEAVLAKANMPGFTEQRVTTKPADGVSAAEPVDPVLEIKGHAVEEDSDLRDRYSTSEREMNSSGRLNEGRGRRTLPGQQAVADPFENPAELQDGVLLDNGGCPVFSEGSNVAAIWADADRRALYESKAAAADDPAGCAKVLTSRRAEADAMNAWKLPGDRRDTAATLRGRTGTVALMTTMAQLYEDVFGDMSTYETTAQDTRTATE